MTNCNLCNDEPLYQVYGEMSLVTTPCPKCGEHYKYEIPRNHPLRHVILEMEDC